MKNTWPPLISSTSIDSDGGKQLYGNGVSSSCLIEKRADDLFFYPTRGLTGFAYDGQKYIAGELATGLDAATASWFDETISETRSDMAEFPLRSLVLITDMGLSIMKIDTDLRMWMIFLRGDLKGYLHNFLDNNNGYYPYSVDYAQGVINIRMKADEGNVDRGVVILNFDFVGDRIYADVSVTSSI